jgi:Fe-S cluster assembly iron-binding protein IscA
MAISLTDSAARHVSRYLSRRGKGIGVRLGVKRACATKDEAVRLTTLKDCRCIFGVLVVWMRGT